MTDDTPEDVAWQADLDRLRAKFGGFNRGLMAAVGDSMLSEANAATAAAEEHRLIESAFDPADPSDFPSPDDPRLDDEPT